MRVAEVIQGRLLALSLVIGGVADAVLTTDLSNWQARFTPALYPKNFYLVVPEKFKFMHEPIRLDWI